jgi:hypothetical protein
VSIEQARVYADRSRLYLANAAATLRERRPEKASEFLWGAMAQALKATAALKEIQLRSHREIRRFGRDTAKELKSEQLLNAYTVAETLHSNFYESMFDIPEVTGHATIIRVAVEELLGLVPAAEGDVI